MLGYNVIESSYVKAGESIVTPSTVFLHPLDVVLLQHPELTAVERVMVLVDRVVDEALARLSS
jgi:hypothetical protein